MLSLVLLDPELLDPELLDPPEPQGSLKMSVVGKFEKLGNLNGLELEAGAEVPGLLVGRWGGGTHVVGLI